MKNLHIFLLFLGFCVVEICIVFLAQEMIPYKGFFPHKQILEESGLSSWIYSLANFDGVHYIMIARQGYDDFQVALFPFYPLFVRLISAHLQQQYLLSGLVLSHVALFGSLVVFNQYLLFLKKKPKDILWTLIFFLAFPTSFYLRAMYTESVFLFFFLLSLYLYEKKQYAWCIVSSFCTSLTRLVGIFLMVPFAVSWLAQHANLEKQKITKWTIPQVQKMFHHIFRSVYTEWKKRKISWLQIVTIVSPVTGLLTYMLFLWVVKDDPLRFLHAQSAFDANRSTDSFVILPQVLYRYIKIFLTAQQNDQYWQAVMEFGVYIGVFGVLILDLLKRAKTWYKKETAPYLGLLLFSFINMILPTLTGTLSSTPRYALMSLSYFLFMSEVRNPWVRGTVLAVSFVLHVFIFGYFVQGYFVG